MSRTIIAKYVAPWKFRREEQQRRLLALRQRDGDDCRRCRRPLRFDLPGGHDRGPVIVELFEPATSEQQSLDHLCLTHGRCNAESVDRTGEVSERIRRRNEAELLSRPRRRRA